MAEAWVTSLIAARDALVRVLENESEREQGLTDEGHPMSVTYSVGGRSFTITGSRRELIEELWRLTELINSQVIPDGSIRLW